MSYRKILKVICTICITIVLAAVSACTIYSFVDKHTMSAKENRLLMTKPDISADEWFSGKFANQTNMFLNDHVYKRTELIKKAAKIEGYLRKEQTVQVMKSNNDRKDIGSDALILHDKILALFIKNQNYLDSIVDASNKLFEQLPDGINKYIMISPTRIEFEDEEYKQYSDSQYESIYEIYSKIDKDVKTIDSYSALKYAVANTDINKLYFKTDHHWTAYGASFAANALLLSMNKNMVMPDMYNEVNAGEFLGYLAVMHSVSIDRMPSEPFIYYECANDINEYAYGVEGADISESIYEPLLDRTRAGYYTFVERSYQYVVIEGKNPQGGNMMMINDSYGNAMVPWMAAQFNKIIMVDPRIFTGGSEGLKQLIDKYEIDDFVISLAGLISGSSFGGEMEKMCE